MLEIQFDPGVYIKIVLVTCIYTGLAVTCTCNCTLSKTHIKFYGNDGYLYKIRH